MNDLDFADDVALLESSLPRARARHARTAAAAADLGLVMSAPGAECMTAGCDPRPPLGVYGRPIGHVTDFGYLGSMVGCGTAGLEGGRALAWAAFWRLGRLWGDPSLPIETGIKLFETACVAILMCGCGSWVVARDV